VTSKQIDFDYLSHEDVVKVIQVFGGRWWKEVNGQGVDYTTEQGGITIRCYQGKPPPNCQLIEEEVVVPARIAKRFRLRCKEEV